MRNDPDDSRWFSWRTLLAVAVPMLAVRSAGRSNSSALGMLRQTLVAFTGALAGIGVVVLYLDAGDTEPGSMSTDVVLAGLLAIGALSLVAPDLVRQPLDCTTDETLAGSYRSRFFLRIAWAQSVALIGFVGFFLSGEAWLYPVGCAFTVMGFIRLAPTDVRLEAEQERLTQLGCPRSLRAALTGGGSGAR